MGESERELIRLVGRVLAVSAPPGGSWRVKVRGKDDGAWGPGWIDVEVEGRPIRVELEGTTCHGPTTDKASGTWRELQPQTPLPADHAPPFKHASFTAVIPKVGDTVAVYGYVLDRGEPENGYREAPPSTVTRVLARLLARGDTPDVTLSRAIRDAYPAAMRPTKRDPRVDDPGNPLNKPPASAWVMTAIALGAAVAAVVVWQQSVVALGLVGCAVIERPARFVRGFRAREEPTRETFTFELQVVAWMYFLLLVCLAPLLQWSWRWSVPIWFGIALVVGLLVVIRLAPYRRLVAARPWQGELGHGALVEGIVRDPTPVTVGSVKAAVGRVEEYDRGVGSDPDKLRSATYHNDKTYFVDGKPGIVEIDPDETMWASTVVKFSESSFQRETCEVIPIHGRVIAVGTIVACAPGAPPRLTARGTRPAVVFATSEHGDPRGLARAIVHHHYLTIGALAVLGGTSMLLIFARG